MREEEASEAAEITWSSSLLHSYLLRPEETEEEEEEKNSH